MTDERRGSPRIAASLAGEIEMPEGKSSIAISRDIGAGGLLVFARKRLAAGTKLKLTVVHEGKYLKLEGNVVRCDDLEPGASTLWRTRVAIAVDPADPVLTALFTAIAASEPAAT